jgi:hypothetical protein
MPPNLRRTGPQLKPDGKTRHPTRIAETRCTLGYVLAGGEAAEAEDHAGAVGWLHCPSRTQTPPDQHVSRPPSVHR